MAATATYSLINILYWNLLSQWMKFVFYRGWTEYWRNFFLPRFGTTAPQWWLDTWYVSAWWRDNLENGKPKLNFWVFYRSAARDRFSDWVAQAADNVARPLADAVSNLLGSLLHSYTTFSDWIEGIRNRVGTWIPNWTSNLATGLNYIKMKLPQSIFSYPYTWDSIWEGIKTAVKDWARLRFDDAMTWVANIAPWLITGYNLVRGWYDLVHSWVTNFKANPYGTIAGTLGAAWTFLSGSYTGLRDFYNNVWVPFKVSLHDFLDHPMLWLYDQVEDYLCERW